MKYSTDNSGHQGPGLQGFQLLGVRFCFSGGLALFSGNVEATEHHGGDGKQGNNAGPALPGWGEMQGPELQKQTRCSLSNGCDGGSFPGDVFPQAGPR